MVARFASGRGAAAALADRPLPDSIARKNWPSGLEAQNCCHAGASNSARTPGSPFASLAFVEGRLDASAPRPPVMLAPETVARHLERARSSTVLATDDWPHLYLAGRRLPPRYLTVLAVVLVASATIVTTLGRPAGLASSLHFALLGAGFMLLQARSITKMALLFGSTWLVNAVVIGFILGCIWLANLLVLRSRAPGPRACGALLIGSLLLGFVLPLDWMLSLPGPARLVAAGTWVAIPVLFASMMFSHSFARAPAPAPASGFGANLLGVVFGGLLEYTSMILGLQALYLVALGVYCLALAAGWAWRRGSVVP